MQHNPDLLGTIPQQHIMEKQECREFPLSKSLFLIGYEDAIHEHEDIRNLLPKQLLDVPG